MAPAATDTLQVGLIGCGHIAQSVHLPILLRLPSAKIAAVSDTDSERRESAARRAPEAAALADYREMLQIPALNAVLICLPTALHAEAAEAALNAGKHVYLEKPISAEISEAQRVLDAWKRAGTAGMIGFNYRFNLLYLAARREIESGRLGDIVAVRSVFAAAPHTLPEWKRTRRTGGGALLDLASHHADLLRFFFHREVERVSCLTRSQHAEDDSALLTIRLENGILAQTFVSLGAAEEDRFEIYGTQGKLTVDRLRSVGVEITGLRQEENTWSRKMAAHWDALTRSSYHLQKRMAVGWEPSYQPALEHFVSAALARRRGEQTEVSPDLEDGYRSLAVIAAAQEAARTGRTVSPEPAVSNVLD